MGDQELKRDLSRTEFRPEQEENNAKAIDSGKKLSPVEQNLWNKKVRYKIREITEIRHGMIAPGSLEEQEVFAAVANFMQSLPPERSKLLKKMNTLLD